MTGIGNKGQRRAQASGCEVLKGACMALQFRATGNLRQSHEGVAPTGLRAAVTATRLAVNVRFGALCGLSQRSRYVR